MSASSRITVRLNGEPHEIERGLTVSELVRSLGRHPEAVAVEHNGRILSRSRFDSTRLEEGDRLEVVHFVQGGAPTAPETDSRLPRWCILRGAGR